MLLKRVNILYLYYIHATIGDAFRLTYFFCMNNKKTLWIAIGAVVLVLIIGIASCSVLSQGNRSNTNGNTNRGSEIASYQGIIRSKGLSLNTPGTHLLEMPDSSTLLLESKTRSLSDYLDQKVTVEGVLENRNGTHVLSVQTVSLSLGNSNDNASISTLLEYSGPLGFTFRYSSIFTINNSTDSQLDLSLADKTLNVERKDDPVITIAVRSESVDDLRGWIKNDLQKESVTIQAGNLDGERIVNTQNADVTLYVKGRSLYEVHFIAPGGKDESKVKNRFYEMLSTFVWPSSDLANSNTNAVNVNNNLNSTTSSNTNGSFYTGEVGTKPVASDTKRKVIDYIKQNLNDLKPADDAITSAVNPTKFEFASDSYVYVEYNDATNKRKLLLKYGSDGDTVKVSQIAYFEPGTTQDWVIKSGSNDASKFSREVYDAGGTKTGESKEGFRLYQNNSVKYALQYPSNWYYSGAAKESGALQTVQFGDKPLDGNEAKITVSVFKSSPVSSGSGSSRVENGDIIVFSVEKDGKLFTIKGNSQYENIMKTMSDSVTVNP